MMLNGQAVIVTGAGRGIGREVALAAAQAGAAVVVNDLGAGVGGDGTDQAPARDVVAEIEARGGRAIAHFGSVADPAAGDALVAAALDAFGRLDGVVNNAGNMVLARIDQMTADQFDKVLAVHLRGSFSVGRAAAAHFVTQGRGAFVHMTSSAGLIGNPGSAGYNAAKAGVAALSRSIALDLAERGIRSNCIAPSALSRMSASVTQARRTGAVAVRPKDDVPAAKRQGNPAQVAPMAVYLLSEAAMGISGQIFGVRGNEIFLYSQPRPVRTLHRSDGWTPEALAAQLEPAWRQAMTPLETLQDVFRWPPQ